MLLKFDLTIREHWLRVRRQIFAETDDDPVHWPINMTSLGLNDLTHWGRVTHICVDNLTTIGSDNALSPSRRQAIIWTSAGILLIGPLGTNFNEILIGIQTFSFKKMHLKMSSAKRRPFCLGLKMLSLYEQQSDVTSMFFNNYFYWSSSEIVNCTGN